MLAYLAMASSWIGDVEEDGYLVEHKKSCRPVGQASKATGERQIETGDSDSELDEILLEVSSNS